MVILLCYIKTLFKNKLDSHECKRLVSPTTARPGKSPPYPGLLNSSMKRKARQKVVPYSLFFFLVTFKSFVVLSSERLDRALAVGRTH